VDDFDPTLRALAADRARIAVSEAGYHRRQAAALEARAGILARTWRLDRRTDFGPREDSVECPCHCGGVEGACREAK
jgi:hypothetical protein